MPIYTKNEPPFVVFVFFYFQSHPYTLNNLRSLIIPIAGIVLLEFFLAVGILSVSIVCLYRYRNELN
ncbi:hypothetical protein Hanom_Chr05g00411891 [Helianthus anomalus]